MRRHAPLARLYRLDALTGLLRDGEHHLAQDLADDLGVSKRTLMRDLDVLRDRGVPIETDQGRGGGVRLHRHWGVGRLNLSYREVIDLLLSLAIMEKVGSPMLLDGAKAVRQKLALSFPESQRQKVQAIRKRLLVGELASAAVLKTYPDKPLRAAEAICDAFFEMRLLELTYVDANGRRTRRTVEPHYLMVNWPVWYLLTWDFLRTDVRCFRVDRIAKAEVSDTGFALKPAAPFIAGFEALTSPV
jgi:predicted DNA-binding transcriptional regulator YafY